MSRQILAVSSGGGHLKQLLRLMELVPNVGRVDWLTYETSLGYELQERLAGTPDRVFFAPAAAPRELRILVRDAVVATRLLRDNHYDLAISTGGAIALTVLPVTRSRGVPTSYVESATRSQGPSTTGRILQYVPGIACFTQYRTYAGRRWSYIGSVFDEYEPGPARSVPHIRTLLVTLGTLESHSFRRLVDRILSLAEPSWEILWQLGSTAAHGLPPATANRSLPAADMRRAIREVDVVISHAGTGTALTAFDEGVCPVLVPRRQEHHEHVDDHQRSTAAELTRRGLAVGVEVDDLSRDTMLEAARRTVRRRAGNLSLNI